MKRCPECDCYCEMDFILHFLGKMGITNVIVKDGNLQLVEESSED